MSWFLGHVTGSYVITAYGLMNIHKSLYVHATAKNMLILTIGTRTVPW